MFLRSSGPYCVRIYLGYSAGTHNLTIVFGSTKSSDSAYWDKGSEEIDAFEKQHEAACGSNWVCCRLRLKSICFEPQEPMPQTEDRESRSPPKKQARCTPAISNLLR